MLKTKESIKQGDALLCLLFNVALEKAIRRAGIQTSHTLATNLIYILGFAEALDIVGQRDSDVIKSFTQLKPEAL